MPERASESLHTNDHFMLLLSPLSNSNVYSGYLLPVPSLSIENEEK